MKKDNVHAGHRERLRRRFITDGANSFEPHQLMELILFDALPLRDTNEIAHRLISDFGGLRGVLNAPESELAKTDGVGVKTAAYLALLGDIIDRYVLEKCALNADSPPAAFYVYLKRYAADAGIKGDIVLTVGERGVVCREAPDGVFNAAARAVITDSAERFTVYARRRDETSAEKLPRLAEMLGVGYIDLSERFGEF